jgi:hypothetical protein
VKCPTAAGSGGSEGAGTAPKERALNCNRRRKKRKITKWGGAGGGSPLQILFVKLQYAPFLIPIKEQLHAKRYLRYMDDIIIFSENKKELNLFIIKSA